MNMETKYLTSPSSLNNRLIVEAYKKEALRGEVKNGFAFVGQKLTLKGLKVLVDAKLNDGTIIIKGSTAYVKEESLHTQAWAQKTMEASYFQEPFLIIDLNHVEFVEPAYTYSFTGDKPPMLVDYPESYCDSNTGGGLPPGSALR